MRSYVLWLCFSLMFILQGCVHATIQPSSTISKTVELKQRYYQAKTTAPDGTVLAFTVYQPHLTANQTAPLILHTHGFGLSRMKRPELSLYGFLLPTGQVVKTAWQNGYWVISYDQRGHGNSQGKIRLTDPEKEAQDVITIMNWAEKNLPQLAKNQHGVRTGMIGESYAGGVQYLASALDPRLQAIVPITTWYDIVHSLAPNGIPKSNWIGFLNLIGDWWNWNKFDPELKQAYLDTQQGQLKQSTYDFLKTHQASWFCSHNQAPQADALIIQGFRDVLFPFNEGVSAAQCIQQAQHEVHLIGVQGGHLQPFTQHSPLGSTPFWYIGKSVRCGNQQQYNLQKTILTWFEQKLKDRPSTTSLPELCVDQSPVNQFSDLKPVTSYDLKKTWIAPTASQAVFVPIYTAQQSTSITGSPLVSLNMQTTSEFENATLFISVAVKSKLTGKYTVLNDQTTPFNPAKKTNYDQIRSGLANQYGEDQMIELASVHGQLNKGDTLGLLINSESPYYQSTKQPKVETWISGKIVLPKLWDKTDSK
ncbi:CocE/NonD family hydrolase [Acinetobacter sp. C26M]|uniref:alpha/beta hydrolase family protein n=1 Tax=unclassified Acinetobacter TaxID=196816 RepID=UPI0020370951|nr:MULTISPECIES: CocE/NonD family hydrolase [unclassified Acinetobacter]USA45764.1 CocE/NonD family hydrolase [Acinetobacter sp. C26M]USA49263.1 CocE/NonD family hydrolase [Acinetobacter sp. C26G]